MACTFRVAAGAGLAIVLLSAAPAPAAAQMRLYVQAFDRATGRLVTDLEAHDVIVREGGVVRPVIDVRPANLPAKLVLLVDNSRSAARAFERVRDGVRRFVERVGANQEVSLLTLSPGPEWVVQGEIDPAAIRAGVDGLDIGGRSARVIDGLVDAAAWVAADAGPHRPVIVVVSADGRDRSRNRNRKFAETVERMTRHGMTVHSLVMLTPVAGSVQRRVSVAEAAGRDLERHVGGSFTAIFLGSRLEDPLTAVADRIAQRNRELARQHLVRYEAADDGAPGRVRVDITRPGIQYIVTPDGRAAP